jgi:hypothetical protein
MKLALVAVGSRGVHVPDARGVRRCARHSVRVVALALFEQDVADADLNSLARGPPERFAARRRRRRADAA